MNRALVGAVLVAALAAASCKEKPKDGTPPPLPDTATPAPPAVPPPPAPTPVPAPSASAPTAVRDTLPTSEDFEQEALDQINPQNIEAELDRLEKEIGK